MFNDQQICTKALQWSSTIMLFSNMTLHTRVEHTVILNREQGGWAHFYKQRNKWTERVSKTSNSIQQYEQLVFTKYCQVLRIRIQMNNSHPDPTICLSSKSQTSIGAKKLDFIKCWSRSQNVLTRIGNTIIAFSSLGYNSTPFDIAHISMLTHTLYRMYPTHWCGSGFV